MTVRISDTLAARSEGIKKTRTSTNVFLQSHPSAAPAPAPVRTHMCMYTKTQQRHGERDERREEEQTEAGAW